DQQILGNETDAALFTEPFGVSVVSGTDGTPLNFIVLAEADLSTWPGPDCVSNQWQGATMGLYRRRGTVFTAATLLWANGLRGPWNEVQQITQNVLQRLSRPTPWSAASPWLPQRIMP